MLETRQGDIPPGSELDSNTQEISGSDLFLSWENNLMGYLQNQRQELKLDEALVKYLYKMDYAQKTCLLHTERVCAFI